MPINKVKQIFTFGYGQKHKGRYVIIEGENREHCRDKMIQRFAMNWANRYDYHRLESIKKAGLEELK